MSPHLRSRQGWSEVALRDVATEYSVRVDNPAESEFERFVGSTHIGRFALTVSNWGSTTEVTSAMKVFQPGDYLFVRRSLYASDFRERAPRATFEGVCSGDILTIREKTGVVAPGYLSVVLNAPEIWAYVVAHATGSITRRIKWRQLQEYTFTLPPLEEQRRIVEALQAASMNFDALGRVAETSRTLREAALNHFFPVGSPPWKVEQQTKLEHILNGIIDYRGRTPQKTESGVPLITAKNVRVGSIDAEPREFIAEDQFDTWMTRGLPVADDILFTTEAPLANVAMAPDYKFAMAQRVLLLRPAPAQVWPGFLYWMLQGPMLRRQIFSRATGSTAKGIKQSSLRKIPVLLPDHGTQKAISGSLDAVSQLIDAAAVRVEKAREILAALMWAQIS